MAQRFPKLTPEQMTPAQREVAAEITAGPRREVRGPFIALIHNPELARRLQKLGEHLRWQGKLPPRLKELAVLVTARRWTCQHEWVMHSKLALEAGLAAGVVQAIRDGKEPQGLSEEEKAVYGFCREVHATGRAGDESLKEIQNRFGLDGALELIALNGYYTLMAMVLNTAGLPLPGDADPPLKPF
ncbi:MAG TPA: carboxymuconolactone decarboxylase family protein [Burkholderiales bacterium]|jgi:4-carboxymuconolactone decarboxylase|nr:carboxymuconolactone decarboxylase family protein [Burkholderiales bacterium]